MTETQPTQRQLAYIEEFASFMARTGLAWMPARVLGWLLVCDPPQQSAAQIADALKASRGAISGAVNLLTTSRLIERIRVRGDRRDYFHIPRDAWTVRIRHGLQLQEELEKLAAKGMDALPAGSVESGYRLRELAEFSRFAREETLGMLEKWEKRQDLP